MVKRLHSGRACQSGVLVALLARRGFTGITNVLEARFGGFCTTLGGNSVDATKLTMGLGKEWEILNVGFKPYPTAVTFHSVLDAARSMMDEHGFRAEDCERIVVHTSTFSLVHCGFAYQPTDATAAQMNLSFCLASMLRFGEVFVDQFTETSIRDHETINLMQCIRHVADKELDELGAAGRQVAWLEVFLRDGRQFTRRADRRKRQYRKPHEP